MKIRTASPSRPTRLTASAAITLVALLVLAAPARAQHTATIRRPVVIVRAEITAA